MQPHAATRFSGSLDGVKLSTKASHLGREILQLQDTRNYQQCSKSFWHMKINEVGQPSHLTILPWNIIVWYCVFANAVKQKSRAKQLLQWARWKAAMTNLEAKHKIVI